MLFASLNCQILHILVSNRWFHMDFLREKSLNMVWLPLTSTNNKLMIKIDHLRCQKMAYTNVCMPFFSKLRVNLFCQFYTKNLVFATFEVLFWCQNIDELYFFELILLSFFSVYPCTYTVSIIVFFIGKTTASPNVSASNQCADARTCFQSGSNGLKIGRRDSDRESGFVRQRQTLTHGCQMAIAGF